MVMSGQTISKASREKMRRAHLGVPLGRSMADPFQVVRDFEASVSEYTGAPYCVSVTSCTMALLLAVAWHLRNEDWRVPVMDSPPYIEIPKRTYISVPMSIIHAGGWPKFRDEDWRGCYRLAPFPIWDCARWFTSRMYAAGQYQCVSFHSSKILADTQGGAILHDNQEADAWLRRARFDGRTEGVAPADDAFTQLGWHCYTSPDVAARLLLKLYSLPKHNEPLPNDDYPDLSKMEIFR